MRKLVSSLILVSMCASTSMQAWAKSSSDKDPEAKKRAVIDKIVETVESDKLTPEEAEAAKKRKRERLEKFGNFVADKMEIPESKRKEFEEKIKEHKSNQSKLPPEVKAELKRKLDMAGFRKDATYKVLGDHLDEKDLKALLKFMKSSTGTKIIKEAPDMALQFGILAGEHFIPIFIDLVKTFKMMQHIVPVPIPGGAQSDPRNKEIIDQMKKLIEQQRPRVPSPNGPGKDES